MVARAVLAIRRSASCRLGLGPVEQRRRRRDGLERAGAAGRGRRRGAPLEGLAAPRVGGRRSSSGRRGHGAGPVDEHEQHAEQHDAAADERHEVERLDAVLDLDAVDEPAGWSRKPLTRSGTASSTPPSEQQHGGQRGRRPRRSTAPKIFVDQWCSAPTTPTAPAARARCDDGGVGGRADEIEAVDRPGRRRRRRRAARASERDDAEQQRAGQVEAAPPQRVGRRRRATTSSGSTRANAAPT